MRYALHMPAFGRKRTFEHWHFFTAAWCESAAKY
jgi:hypothetical protein